MKILMIILSCFLTSSVANANCWKQMQKSEYDLKKEFVKKIETDTSIKWHIVNTNKEIYFREYNGNSCFKIIINNWGNLRIEEYWKNETIAINNIILPKPLTNRVRNLYRNTVCRKITRIEQVLLNIIRLINNRINE